MRKSKAIMIVFISIIIVLTAGIGWLLNDKYGFISYGAKKPTYHYTIGDFTIEDLGVFDTKTGKMLYVGMKKDEVDKILGDGVEEQEFMRLTVYADNLNIKYRLDQVVAISLTEDSSRYVTARNMGVLNSRQEIEYAYGKPSFSDDRYTDYYLHKIKDESYLKLLPKLPIDQDELTKTFIMSVSSSEDGNRIMISDFKFARDFN
ncbi:outer membrane protein assembly factor BamE (lipoprotein component of BamABCDE complex) [Paenibacillus anaericanus]|uniref:hypothetical protein n=1 Tax=Paenibacillus anaericanus TaxID=170367 RepID=UPI002783454C|nr:hypothetical protein [Paenibacillus anaericanus]MDQ0087346.1 outer membrane protein assembly factor BamE (lipoprotein component of BamABCDE complex) [Paenibacillus anaericanus]